MCEGPSDPNQILQCAGLNARQSYEHSRIVHVVIGNVVDIRRRGNQLRTLLGIDSNYVIRLREVSWPV